LFLKTFKWRKNKGGDLLEPAGKQAGYAKKSVQITNNAPVISPKKMAE